MDLENIKKINELTKQLQKYHFAESSIDATKNASDVFQEKQIELPEKNEEQEEKISINLLEKKYHLMLELNNKKIEKNIQELTNSLNELTQQVTHMKIELAKKPIQIFKEENTQKTAIIEQEKQQKEETTKQEKKEQKTETITHEQKKEQHPRQGNYKSEDVSIEKFFYYGKK